MNIVDGPRKAFVLVVDSDCPRGRSLGSELRSLGYYVALASSGAEALQYVDENEPDAVALDWDCRDMPGLELARRLTTRSRKPKILVLKNEMDWRSLRHALECGGDDLLERPLSTMTLSRVLARQLDRVRRSTQVSPERAPTPDGGLFVARCAP